MSAIHPLLSGRRIGTSAAWHLLGQVLPLAAAVAAIPSLLRTLGEERFGVLALAWPLVGTFGLFDLGLGWALTRVVAVAGVERREPELPATVWPALVVMAALGVLGASVLAALAGPLARDALRVPEPLRDEAVRAFRVLALSLPFVTLSAGLTGILGAYQRFDVVNRVRLPLGLMLFALPAVVAWFAPRLVPVFASLVALRVTACAGWFALARRHAPVLNGAPRFAWSRLLPLLRFGGWMSVTNTVGPLLVYADRFLIGGLLSMTAVTAYTTPWEIATRVLVVASPVAVVLFPSFTMAWSADRDRLGRLFDAGWRAVWLLVFPAVFALAALTPELLQRWVGPDLASRSAPVLRWLAAGVLLNGIGQIALGLVQGTGHPQWSARLHVLEVPAYAAALVALVLARGIEGAAMAWTARVAVDSAALFLMTRRLLPDRRPGPGPVAAAVIGVGAIGLVSMPMPLAPRLALAALVAAACVMAGLRLARPLLSAALGRGTPR